MSPRGEVDRSNWVYGARVAPSGGVYAWRSSSRAVASTLARSMRDGLHLVPYSTVDGSAGAWALWYDVLLDLTDDAELALRFAGQLAAEMSWYLRMTGSITLRGQEILSWLTLASVVDGFAVLH